MSLLYFTLQWLVLVLNVPNFKAVFSLCVDTGEQGLPGPEGHKGEKGDRGKDGRFDGCQFDTGLDFLIL